MPEQSDAGIMHRAMAAAKRPRSIGDGPEIAWKLRIYGANPGVARSSMSILVGLHHATRYTYDRPISLGPQTVRLRPAPHCRTRIPSYSLTVTPAQHFVNWLQDPHGNWLARYVFPEKTTEFTITVDLLADMEVINPFDFFVEPYAEKWPFKFPAELREDLAAYVEPEPVGPRLKELVASISREPRNTVDFLVELNQRLPAHDPLSRPHGAGRADARGNAGLRRRLLPRYRVAPGADPAPARTAGPLRLRLSHSIAARRAADRRRRRHRARFYRSACLDRGLYSGRRLGRSRRDVGTALRRRPHSACRDAALPLGRADQRHGRTCRGHLRLRHDRHADRRTAARDRAVFRGRPGPRSTRSARRSMPISKRTTCA